MYALRNTYIQINFTHCQPIQQIRPLKVPRFRIILIYGNCHIVIRYCWSYVILMVYMHKNKRIRMILFREDKYK